MFGCDRSVFRTRGMKAPHILYNEWFTPTKPMQSLDDYQRTLFAEQ